MKKWSFQMAGPLFLLALLGLFPMTGLAHTILVFGDSLSAGYGLQTEESWPYLLGQRLQAEKFGHYQVINASISGETTTGGLVRFRRTFDKHRPEIVILELGANDGLRGQSLQTMQQNLEQMIQYSLAHKARVVLAGMRIPPNYGRRYTDDFHRIFQQLQQQHNIELIPFLLEGLMDTPGHIQDDGMHPTASAQPVIVNLVWKSLKPLLQTPQETVTLDKTIHQ